MKPTVKYLVIGALAGMANGLFGSGGGLFLVPLLTSWTGMKQKHAFATSIAIIVPLSLVSFIVFLVRGGFDLSLSWPYLIGGAAGGVLSGVFFKNMSATLLRRLFGMLLLYGGIRAVLLL
ncbi:MAG: sulfite exporter TauE/SafE family protein [Clostridia bacterium]|nr:sulfite exporter TauE/SafE family protein [Clostridia bacterium]